VFDQKEKFGLRKKEDRVVNDKPRVINQKIILGIMGNE